MLIIPPRSSPLAIYWVDQPVYPPSDWYLCFKVGNRPSQKFYQGGNKYRSLWMLYDVSLLYNEVFIFWCCQIVTLCLVDSTCVVCLCPKILCNLQLATICSNKEVRVMISPPEEVFDPWNGMRLIWLGQKCKDCWMAKILASIWKLRNSCVESLTNTTFRSHLSSL
jgi:hypothetical protein